MAAPHDRGSSVTRFLARRTTIDVVAIVLCATLLVLRTRTLLNQPRVVLAPRVAQFTHNRMLAQRIEDYARRYGRPAYYLDSVVAHLDSADAKIVSRLRTDSWGDPVRYMWTWCDFTLSGGAGRANQPGGFRYSVSERYPWPDGVGRTENCFSGS